MFKRPEPGDLITVTVKPAVSLPKRKPVTYKNVKVLEPFNWLSTHEFCIPSDEPHFKVRVIHLRHVTKLKIEGKQTKKLTRKGTNRIPVPGSKGNSYIVTVKDGVATHCECVGYGFRRSCRHLKEGEKIFQKMLTRS